jgi:hypothetical protein
MEPHRPGMILTATMALALRIITAAFALLALAAPATADPGGERGLDSFEGTCALAGAVRQDPPITNVPAPGSASARAQGTCSGTLTDARGRTHTLDAAHATYAATATGTVGCGGGTANGAGVLAIHGRRIDFRFAEVRGPGAAAVRIEGESGGSATGEALVSADEDPVRIAEQCGGAGLRSVRIDITLATTPALSG